MAISGREYADRVRALRDSGFDFPASNGYVLRDAANWSRGQKAAVTRAFNSLESEAIEIDEGELTSDIDLGESDRAEIFDESAGDNFEEWDDIDFFDYEEADDFGDDEGDTYAEDTA